MPSDKQFFWAENIWCLALRRVGALVPFFASVVQAGIACILSGTFSYVLQRWFVLSLVGVCAKTIRIWETGFNLQFGPGRFANKLLGMDVSDITERDAVNAFIPYLDSESALPEHYRLLQCFMSLLGGARGVSVSSHLHVFSPEVLSKCWNVPTNLPPRLAVSRVETLSPAHCGVCALFFFAPE